MSDGRRTDGTGIGERERFFALLERELADEVAPNEEERAFSERMGGRDRECAAFGRTVDRLRRMEPVPGEMIGRAIEEHWARARRLRVRAVGACGAALAIAAAAALVLVVGPPPKEERGRGAGVAGVPSTPSFALVERGGAPGGVGHVFSAGETPRLLEDLQNLSVGVDRGSGVELVEASERSVSVRIERGRAAFHLRPGSPRGLRVMTPLCDVVVEGTVFSVAVGPEDVRVGVVRGAVLVEKRDGGSARVKAGETLSVRDGSRIGLEPNEKEEILSLLDMSAPGVPGEAAAGPVGSAVRDDEGNAAPQRGRGAGEKPESRGSGAVAETAGAVPAQAGGTPAELIRQARERVRVHDWYGAAELYRRILRDFPGRPEAVTVRVSLADIELDHLRDPGAALADYQGYLATAPGGALAEDALWGTCRSHQRLGQVSKEKRSLEEFIRRFPQSIQVKNAEERLFMLEK